MREHQRTDHPPGCRSGRRKRLSLAGERLPRLLHRALRQRADGVRLRSELRCVQGVRGWLRAKYQWHPRRRLSAGLRDAIEKAPDAVAADSATEALINGGGTALRDAVRADANSVREAVDAPLGDWCLLTESDPRRGEAQASADAALANADAFPGADGETDTTDYLIKNVFLYGGKEPCEPITESSMVKRTWHRVATVFQVKNPDMYAAATAVRSVQHVVPPGGTPPPAESLDDTSEVTVVMLRNLGNKRMIPFVFAVVTFLGFVIFTTMLHYRDKEAMAVRAAFSGAGAGK